ncbi:hypothetical protein CBL_07968 [Carabus blaptoides fortunei]
MSASSLAVNFYSSLKLHSQNIVIKHPISSNTIGRRMWQHLALPVRKLLGANEHTTLCRTSETVSSKQQPVLVFVPSRTEQRSANAHKGSFTEVNRPIDGLHVII